MDVTPWRTRNFQKPAGKLCFQQLTRSRLNGILKNSPLCRLWGAFKKMRTVFNLKQIRVFMFTLHKVAFQTTTKKKQVKYFFQTATACEMCSKPLVEIIKVMHRSTTWKTEISNSVQNFPPGKKRSIWFFPEKSGSHYGWGAKFGGIVQISRKA